MDGIMVYTTSETLNRNGKQMPDNYFFCFIFDSHEHPVGWLSFFGHWSNVMINMATRAVMQFALLWIM